MDIILNPIVISSVVMITLCLLKLNVFLSITAAGVLCFFLGGAPLGEGMTTFINGMGTNMEIVFNMFMFGMLATAMEQNNVGAVLVPRVAKVVGKQKWLLPIALCVMGAISETFILIYVAFVPIIVPPLLDLFNEYKIDRRMLVTACLCGLLIGYVCVPAGFGLMFQEIVQGELAANGLNVEIGQVWRANLVLVLAFLIGLGLAIFVYRKPREYKKRSAEEQLASNAEMAPVEWKHIACVLAAILAVITQIITGSMPMGSVVCIIFLLVSGAVKLKNLESVAMGGISSMAFVAAVLMVASGYAAVSRTYGDVDGLVAAITGLIGGSKILGAIIMLALGLLVTIGIGSAWSTIPVVAAVLVPMGMQMGFSPAAIILLVSASAALGDAGSPSSDQTLVPTAGFNMDGQHDHIYDTCVPTFIWINGPLLVVTAIAACMM